MMQFLIVFIKSLAGIYAELARVYIALQHSCDLARNGRGVTGLRVHGDFASDSILS